MLLLFLESLLLYSRLLDFLIKKFGSKKMKNN